MPACEAATVVISANAAAGTPEAVPASATDSPSRPDGSHDNHMPVV